MSLVNEMYFAITLDRKTAGPVCPLTVLWSVIYFQQSETVPATLPEYFMDPEFLFMKLDIYFDASFMIGCSRFWLLSVLLYFVILLPTIECSEVLRCFGACSILQLIIACRKGGTSIEDLAEKFPDMIIKVVICALDPFSPGMLPFASITSIFLCTCIGWLWYFFPTQVPIDVFKGITDEDAAKVVDGLAPKVADRNDSIEQVKKLYKLFCECDCTMLEVSIS